MAKFRRTITPTGRRMLQVAAEYGLTEKIDVWAKEIVDAASRNKRPLNDLVLQDVLEELNDLATTAESDWKLSARRFCEAGWLEKLNAIRATVMQRKPPYRFRVNTRLLPGLSDGSVLVEVRMVYEINAAKREVVFHAFDFSTPASRNAHRGTGQAEDW